MQSVPETKRLQSFIILKMKMKIKRICESCFIILLSTIVTTIQSKEWSKEHFPNPTKDRESCGRQGVKSWICDPDNILKYHEANILEEILQHIATKTNSGCSRDSEFPGYQVGVAIMKKMAVPQDMGKDDIAEEFTRHLHNTWGVGNFGCDDGALLLISTQDRKIYVTTGVTARERLSNDQINIIIEKMKTSLRQEKYGESLHLAAKLMHEVFSGEKLKEDSNLLLTIFCWVGFMPFFLGCIIYPSYKKRQYENCKEKLKRIERERDAAKNSKSYMSASCPICLENFTPQMCIRLLLCRHKYCESCLSKWLKTNATCPICRQSTSTTEDKVDRSSIHDILPELAFRLRSLQTQYPYYVSHDMIHHWTSMQYSDSFVDDPVFSQESQCTTGTGELGSDNNFGGGGCSGGGGCGGSW